MQFSRLSFHREEENLIFCCVMFRTQDMSKNSTDEPYVDTTHYFRHLFIFYIFFSSKSQIDQRMQRLHTRTWNTNKIISCRSLFCESVYESMLYVTTRKNWRHLSLWLCRKLLLYFPWFAIYFPLYVFCWLA